MDLRHLRYFIAVAEEGHITRAAERLGMQQPPLSQQIRAMERALDVQLFRRLPRGVALTDAGRSLLEDARLILAKLDRAVATTKRAARGEQGRIAVGFTSSSPFHPLVPQTIRGFREAFPQVALTLRESGTTNLVEALRQERVDVAFIRTQVADAQGLSIHTLLEEPMVAAMPDGHCLIGAPEAGGHARLELSALANETFVLYRRPEGPGLYDAIIGACLGAGFNPRIGQEAPRIVSTLNLVAAGLGISLVPASLQRMHMDGVTFCPLHGPTRPMAALSLVSRRGDPSSVVRRFTDQVRRMARDFDQGRAVAAA